MPQTPHDTSPADTAQTAEATATAVTAIHRLVADAERLQSDVDGFTGLLTDDAVIVDFGGRRVRGRAAIRLAQPSPPVVGAWRVNQRPGPRCRS
jgi:hypothetical protein